MLLKKYDTFSGSIGAPSVVEPRKPHCRRFEPKHQCNVTAIILTSEKEYRKKITTDCNYVIHKATLMQITNTGKY